MFRGFLRNSRKYGLGSLRKIPSEGIPPIIPDPTSGQLDLSLQQQQLSIHHFEEKPKKWLLNWQTTLLQTSTHNANGNWVCCKHSNFLINCPWCGKAVLQSLSHNTSVLLNVSHGRALRSILPFSMTVSNPLILHSHDSGWMSTSVTGDIRERYSNSQKFCL